jgi:hypothetical protein
MTGVEPGSARTLAPDKGWDEAVLFRKPVEKPFEACEVMQLGLRL